MVDFEGLFIQSRTLSIAYGDDVVRRLELIPVRNADRVTVSIESTNSEWKQGIHIGFLDRMGAININNQSYKHGILLWEDTAPDKVEIEVLPQKKEGILAFWNIWDTGNGSVCAKSYGAAMIREDIPNGARYRCNDGHPDDNFDDIIFTLVKTKGVWEPPLEKSPYLKD